MPRGTYGTSLAAGSRPGFLAAFVIVAAGFQPGAAARGAQRAGAARSVNWPLHNLDLAGSRFSTMDQINRSNVATLAPRWLFQTRHHRRRQQSDDAGHRRRLDVRDRSARQRLRARRRRRASALDLRRHRPDRRRRSARLHLPQPRRRATPTAWSTPPRDRFCSRSTRRPASRSQLRQGTARRA